MKELYERNKDFREYVDRYCRNKDITADNALNLIHVRLVGQHYKELENSKDESSISSCNNSTHSDSHTGNMSCGGYQESWRRTGSV